MQRNICSASWQQLETRSTLQTQTDRRLSYVFFEDIEPEVCVVETRL